MNEKQLENKNITMGIMPWVLIGLSVFCMIAYVILSSMLECFSMGTFICMFIVVVPIQLFLTVYFSNAIKNDSYNTIAGFDSKIEYNMEEVKKLLVQLTIYMGMLSTVYIFLFCTVNLMNLEFSWLNQLLLNLYTVNFVLTIMIENYRAVDKLYKKEEDKVRARRNFSITVLYIGLLFVGLIETFAVFHIKGIENNTAPALKVGGLLLLGVVFATLGFFIDSNRIQKWIPSEGIYKSSITNIICAIVCMIAYGMMWMM